MLIVTFLFVGIGKYDGGNWLQLEGVSTDYENVLNTFGRFWGYSFFYRNADNQNTYLSSKNDYKQLKNNYNWKLHWNYEEIVPFVKKARDQILSFQHDALLIIISSHGEQDDTIVTSDDEEFPYLGLTMPFEDPKHVSEKQLEILKKLPKILIIDACRGPQVAHWFNREKEKERKQRLMQRKAAMKHLLEKQRKAEEQKKLLDAVKEELLRQQSQLKFGAMRSQSQHGMMIINSSQNVSFVNNKKNYKFADNRPKSQAAMLDMPIIDENLQNARVINANTEMNTIANEKTSSAGVRNLDGALEQVEVSTNDDDLGQTGAIKIRGGGGRNNNKKTGGANGRKTNLKDTFGFGNICRHR